MCKRRLFNRPKRANFVATARGVLVIDLSRDCMSILPGTNDSKYCRCQKDPVITAQAKDYSTGRHQQRSKSQDRLSAQPICNQGQEEADDGISDQSQCHEQPDATLAVAQRVQVGDENES